MTAEELINQSITEDRTVTAYPATSAEQTALHEDLLVECDDDCSPVDFSGAGCSGPESRGYVEYWGADDDGNNWRVHVVNSR